VAPEKSSRRARATIRGYLGACESPRRGAENALNRRKISSEWKLREGSVYRWWRRDVRADDRSFDPFTPPPGRAGGGGGGGYNPYDTNADGVVDIWRSVVNTSDPCGNNFDGNDRLGVNLGGTNTTRPDHNGVDIQANYGDAVCPAFSGSVENVGVSGGCGYRVQIRNTDGSHTTYVTWWTEAVSYQLERTSKRV
jgi:murein DD-endopeptidase MepM/ murein hydrolase activator NlpD